MSNRIDGADQPSSAGDKHGIAKHLESEFKDENQWSKMMEDLRRIDPKQIAEINRQLLQDTKVTDKLGQLELVEKDGHCVALSKELHNGIEVTSEQRATDNLGFEGPFLLPVSYAANGFSITEHPALNDPQPHRHAEWLLHKDNSDKYDQVSMPWENSDGSRVNFAVKSNGNLTAIGEDTTPDLEDHKT